MSVFLGPDDYIRRCDGLNSIAQFQQNHSKIFAFKKCEMTFFGFGRKNHKHGLFQGCLKKLNLGVAA
jgi:hypothetical protein